MWNNHEHSKLLLLEMMSITPIYHWLLCALLCPDCCVVSVWRCPRHSYVVTVAVLAFPELTSSDQVTVLNSNHHTYRVFPIPIHAVRYGGFPISALRAFPAAVLDSSQAGKETAVRKARMARVGNPPYRSYQLFATFQNFSNKSWWMIIFKDMDNNEKSRKWRNILLSVWQNFRNENR